jgi:hypothetical protein
MANTPQQTLNVTSQMLALKEQELLKKARTVDPDLRKFIARKALKSQIVRKQKSYYSTIRFPFNVTPVAAGGGPVTQWDFTLAKKKVVAFSYGVQDDATAAGFPKDFISTEAETNLVAKGDTGGATVEISGISLYLGETSDARLAKLIWANTFVDITLDGSNRYTLLGRMGRIPSSGGLYGLGDSFIQTPPLGASTAQVGALTNGLPQANNFMRLSEKIRWNPSSKIDSKFQLRFEVVRDIGFRVTARPPSPNVAGFTPPTNPGDEGTFVDVVVYLQTQELLPRTLQP